MSCLFPKELGCTGFRLGKTKAVNPQGRSFRPGGRCIGEAGRTYQVGGAGVVAESEALLALAFRVPVQPIWSQGFVTPSWE